jgi:tRNA(fMet)-specific endonuclease VapC
MHPLDTDTLTHLYARHPKVIANLKNVADPLVTTTIITKIEGLRGRESFLLKAVSGSEILRAQRFLQRTEEFLEQLFIVPFDDGAAQTFDKLKQVYK